jgi:competence protein ComEA
LNNTRKWLAASMLLLGGTLLGVTMFHSETAPDGPGWEPVNEAISASLNRLDEAKETEKSAESLSQPTPSPADAKSGTSAIDKNNSHAESGNPSTDSPSPEVKEENAKFPTSDVASNGPSSGLLDLNRATVAELESLPGIGPSKAKAIVAYREEHKGFASVEQLQEVKGIGDKLYAKLAGHVTVRR